MAKKLWEILEEEEEKNKESRLEAVKQANEQFNEYTSKKGTYDTSKHTTSMNSITKAKKNNSEESAKNFKKVNNLTLLDSVEDTANGIGKNIDNTWQSLKNGILSFRQQIGRVSQDNATSRTLDLQNNFLEEQLNKKPNDEKAKALLNKYTNFQSNLNQESGEYLSNLQEKMNKNTRKIIENTESIDNPILKKTSELASSIGQMLPGLIGGPLGTTYFIGSASGNYYNDAMQRGMTEEQATMYSGTMGIIEGTLESIGAGLTKNVGKQLLKKNIKGALLNYGLDIGENFLEESIVEPLSELAAQTYAGKEKANWQDIGQRMIESGIDGALVSAITGGVSGAIGAVSSQIPQQSTYRDYNTNQKLDSNTQNILKQAENIINQNNDINSLPVYNEQNRYLNKIYEESAKKYNIDINNETVKAINRVTQERGINTTFNADLFTDNNINAIWKINVNPNGNNTREVILNPNANSKKTLQNVIVHELTHDFEGTAEYNELKDLILSYDEGNIGFENARKSLEEIYSKVYDKNSNEFQSLVDSEAVADILGNKLGDQKFINSLTIEKPSTARKIYNWIVDKLNKINKLIGYSSEKLFWADVKNKFENAYRQDFQGQISDTKYSIAGRKSLENIRSDTNSYSIGIKAYNQALSLAKQKVDNEQIRQQTGWFQDKNGDWKYEFSDKDMALKNNIRLEAGKTYKLGRILKHDTLFTLYPSLNNMKVKIEDTKKIGGNYNENKKIITLNGAILKNKKIIERNLIHEIQHAIQDIEGFETGITSKLSKKVYYENLGEIEADNVSKRFIDEKYNNKDIRNEAPESSKANPKHRYYEQYMENRGILDKIKDGVFKYFKKGGNSNEFSQENMEQINETPLRDSNHEVWNRLEKNRIEESENNSGSFNLKEKQLEIINKSNPMQDDYHTGIRSIEDIKTLQETIEDSDWADYDEFNPDLTKNDIEEAIKSEKIIVYSSYPIENGIFISPSRMEAESYSRDGNVYAKEVNIKDIAWIDPTQGQYAKTSDKYSINSSNTWQSYLDENYKNTGKGQTTKEVKLQVIQNKQEQLNNITNIEDPKNIELPSNKEKAKENKIAKILTEPIKQQKSAQRTWAILTANFIDKGAVFETISLKTNNRKLQAKYDATLSSGAKGQFAIGNDRYTFENGKQTLQSKSLTSIINEVGENPNEFYNYMYHQLNIDRMTLEERYGTPNKPVFSNEIDAEYSKQKVLQYEKKYPEFKSYAQDVYDFLNANKKELVDSGVISQELSDKFKEMYPHYVPISRVNKNNNTIQVPLDTKRTGINNPIKKAKGGSQDIQPMFHTIADRTLQTYRASARNSFGVELKNTLEKNNLLNSINENTDIDTIIDTMADEKQTGLTEGTKYKNPTFTVFENGEKITYDINQDMYDALKPQNELIKKLNENKFFKGANKISNIRRGLLTEYNPLFSITNSIKDFQDVLQNSQHALKTYKKFPEAYVQILGKGYWYNEYIQNGGKQNSYFKDGNFNLNENLPKTKNIITMPFKAISKMNNVIEMAPRLAEYIASRENGNSIETSMLDASRVTTNFKAGGDITKFANRNGATFLNAGIQGMAQQIRNIREANARGLKGYSVLTAKTILAGVPTLILNNLIWNDDEDYEELQDYVKDNYYIVGKIGEHQFIRIPKGRTTAVIQKLFTTADKYITKEKEINIENFAEDFWTNLVFVKDNIAPNNPIDNNIISPLVQVANNETWYGEDLVPSRLQDVPNAEQYDETTDKFSRWLGQTLNLSPIKINYLLDQYGGGISDVLLPLGTPQAENNPIEDKFTTNSVMKSKYPGEFFEMSDELKVKSNSEKSTDEDKLRYKYFSTVSEETSKLYKEKREIQNSTLTDEEKKKKILEVQKKINSLTKEAVNTVDTLKLNGNTATIGENKYYKTANVKDGTKTWKELSEEETKKNKNISLKTYADYKEKVIQETIKQRKSGNIDEDDNLKDKDKISILINSNYANKEKQSIYENYIKDKNDIKYDIIKSTGLNINSYLRYKLADSEGKFASDKKDDGTVNGKTISGSAKNKKYSYINNMENVTYVQKAILFGLEYTPNKNDKSTIVNYISSLQGKTNKEKLELLSEFNWIKIYKDGTIFY